MIEPFKLEQYFAQYEFSAPHLLCSSHCETFSIGELLAFEETARDSFDAVCLGYTESAGAPDLRAQVAKLYRATGPEQVLVHSGAEEAIYVFMSACVEAGDHLIVHDPSYQSLQAVARARGVEITRWRADEARGWALDTALLTKALRANTKGVVLNTPHNPTGYLMNADAYRGVIELCRAHGLWLFSDEVYRGVEYVAADALPAACDLYERAVSLGVMSKAFGLPGLRIGWVATHDAKVLRAMGRFKDYTTKCNSAPSEFLACLALRNRSRVLERNHSIILSNLDLLETFFAEHEDLFAFQRPKAGPIAFPRLRVGSASAFCDRLVQQAGVLLLPSVVYDAGDSHFRIGFGRRDMPAALAAWRGYLDASSRPNA